MLLPKSWLAASVALLLSLSGCASGGARAGRAPGTVVGVVLSGPRCGGPARADLPCPPGPVYGSVVTALAGDRTVAAMKTDRRGRFRFSVPPGTYRIRATNVGRYRSSAQKTVVLTAGSRMSMRLVLDTGIR